MIDQKEVEYIKKSLAQGIKKEALYQEFLAKGFLLEDIQAGFNLASQKDEEKEDTSKKTVTIIVTIGAVLIGAGIFSFIASNWEYLSKIAKLSIILISLLATYGIGWYLQEKYKFEKTGAALYLLGSIIYGSGIFLVAQMFDIRIDWSDGFVLWMIGVIAVALALDSFSHFYLAIILGFIAVVGSPIDIFPDFYAERFSFFTSLSLLIIATLLTFFVGWKLRKRVKTDLIDYY